MIFLVLMPLLLLFDGEVQAQQNETMASEVMNSVFGAGDTNGQKKFQPCGDNNICVPFYHCEKGTGQTNTAGVNLVSVRIDTDTTEQQPKPKCRQYLETCCSFPSKSEPNSIGSIVIEKKERKPPSPDTPKVCGTRNVESTLFKVKDAIDESEYLEFPWMVAVLENKSGNGSLQFVCGGSLIHPKVVLTAAHCVVKSSAHEIVVRAGEWDPSTTNEHYEHQDLYIIEIILHEKFGKAGLHNDIALLITGIAFELGDDVMPICLPPPNTNFDYSQCVATGWGRNQWAQQDTIYQAILKKVDLPIVPYDICLNQLRDSLLGPFFQLHESFVCAGAKDMKDTCKGDGGGPLICPIANKKNRYYQVGITAWGIECTGDYPGAYVKVSLFRDWIDTQMAARLLESAYYIA